VTLPTNTPAEYVTTAVQSEVVAPSARRMSRQRTPTRTQLPSHRTNAARANPGRMCVRSAVALVNVCQRTITDVGVDYGTPTRAGQAVRLASAGV